MPHTLAFPLVLATGNPHKVEELRAILADVPIVGLADLDPPPEGFREPEEVGNTFEANATIKALSYAEQTGRWCLADDSGLEVDALGGAPGVQSARFGGAGATYPEKFVLLYAKLREAGALESPARFVCALALVSGGEVLFEASGTIEGRVAREPAGSGGFGYDPIFHYPPFGCTLAEAGARKSEVSHRAEAFRKLRAFLLA